MATTVKQHVAMLYREFCKDPFYTATITTPEMEVWLMDYPIEFICNNGKRKVVFTSISKGEYLVKTNIA